MKTNSQNCIKISQLSASLLVLFAVAPMLGEAQERRSSEAIFKALSPLHKVATRAPSSSVPNRELEILPTENVILLERAFVEDDSGLLTSMKMTISNWEEKQEYARLWNLESTGLYSTPSQEAKFTYVSNNMLKYVDKRLSGEVKRAEKGSSMAKVATVSNALKPQSEMSLTKGYNVKVRARVLQGQAAVKIINPYVELEQNMKITGEFSLRMGKKFEELGTSTEVNYSINEGRWIASVDQKIVGNLSGRVSSQQADKEMAFSESADRKVELLYNDAF